MLLHLNFRLFSASFLAANSPLGDFEPIALKFLSLRLITNLIFKLNETNSARIFRQIVKALKIFSFGKIKNRTGNNLPAC